MLLKTLRRDKQKLKCFIFCIGFQFVWLVHAVTTVVPTPGRVEIPQEMKQKRWGGHWTDRWIFFCLFFPFYQFLRGSPSKGISLLLSDVCFYKCCLWVFFFNDEKIQKKARKRREGEAILSPRDCLPVGLRDVERAELHAPCRGIGSVGEKSVCIAWSTQWCALLLGQSADAYCKATEYI